MLTHFANIHVNANKFILEKCMKIIAIELKVTNAFLCILLN